MNGRRPVLWALLLIAIGVVLLLREAGIIPEDVAWWPIIVFGIGLWLLLERIWTRDDGGGEFVLPLVLMAVGVIFFLQQSGIVAEDVELWPLLLIAIGLGIVLSALPLGRGSPTAERASVPIGDASRGRVVVKHGAGRLRIRSTHDPTVIVDGTFVGGIEPRQRRTGDELEVTLERHGWVPWSRHAPFDWEIGLSPRVPVSLRVDAGANRAELDLTDLTVPELRVNVGASDTSITMPGRGRTRAFVACGAASVKIRIPGRTPARITLRTGLMGVHVDETRFPRAADGYRSNDFDDAGDGVDLTVEGGAASLDVR